MKKETTKATRNTEAQLLELLKRVLPKATPDAQLAVRIYEAVETELKSKARGVAFDKFCSRVELTDLEPASIQMVKQQLGMAFGDGDVTLKPDRKEKTLAVEVALADGTQFSGQIPVNPDGHKADPETPELKLKFIPFPISLPTDPELIWLLAKHETLTHDEAGIALAKVEEDYWASKAGQKALRDRVERIFPEFIARVPSGALTEVGLKRHYKLPEPLKVLRPSKLK